MGDVFAILYLPAPHPTANPGAPSPLLFRKKKITAINGTHGRSNDTNQEQQDLKMPLLIEDGDARSVSLYVH